MLSSWRVLVLSSLWSRDQGRWSHDCASQFFHWLYKSCYHSRIGLCTFAWIVWAHKLSTPVFWSDGSVSRAPSCSVAWGPWPSWSGKFCQSPVHSRKSYTSLDSCALTNASKVSSSCRIGSSRTRPALDCTSGSAGSFRHRSKTDKSSSTCLEPVILPKL